MYALTVLRERAKKATRLQLKPKKGSFKWARNPQNEDGKIKILSFSLGSELSRTIFIFGFQFHEVFFIFIFLYLRGYEMDPKMTKKQLSNII